MLIDGEITSGHGRTLLMIEDSELQEGIANEIVKNKYSVRETGEIN